jgi:hypothetical protein
LGINENKEYITFPKKLNLNFQVSQISLGENHTLLISNTGKVYSCGNNINGQLGLKNSYINTLFPTPIFDNYISNVFAGKFNSFITTNLYTCNGISQYENNICSGNGNCIDNLCICNFGYFGKNCEFKTCFGILSKENEISNKGCSSNGKCIGHNKCDCSFGYSGFNCSEYTCNNIPYYLDLGCNQLGRCIKYNNCSCFNHTNIKSIDQTCTCRDGYFGPSCSLFTCNEFSSNSNSSSICSGRGKCESYNKCICNNILYSGDNCEDISRLLGLILPIILLFVVLIIIILTTLIIIYIIYYFIKKQKKIQLLNKELTDRILLINDLNKIDYKKIKYNKINGNNEVLGKGASSIVYKGKYNGINVAIKEIISSEFAEMLITELVILKNIDHKNVIKYFGYSIDHNGKFFIITGNLNL